MELSNWFGVLCPSCRLWFCLHLGIRARASAFSRRGSRAYQPGSDCPGVQLGSEGTLRGSEYSTREHAGETAGVIDRPFLEVESQYTLQSDGQFSPVRSEPAVF